MALDAAYGTDGSAAAALAFADWPAAVATGTWSITAPPAAAYEPGAFYRRELPLLAAVLAVLPTRPRLVVIDGYVDLGTEPRPGLGRHLWLALGGTVPVVGVAKTAYAGTSTAAVVRRGRSRQPLHVTAVGIPLAEAAAGVAAMHGADRLPTLLVAVDHAARAALAGR